MKKITSLVLLAVMLVSVFAGCNNQSRQLVGTWIGEADLSTYFNEQLAAADEELSPYWHIDRFPLTLVMTFRSDGTYTITVDEDKLATAIEDLKTILAEGFREYLQDMIETSDKTMTVDELLQSLNISIEGQINSALGDDVADEIVRKFSCEGNFEVDDGRLYTSAGKEFKVSKDIYEPFTLSGDTLTLLSPVGAADTGIYPIVLHRAGN